MTWRIGAVSLGVRIAAFDGDRIMLVRHTYLSGWYLPGGGVNRGEDACTAAMRELDEESGLACSSPPALFALYRQGRHGHVALYVTRSVRATGRARPRLEIEAASFFPRSALPPGTSEATHRRLQELDATRPPSRDW